MNKAALNYVCLFVCFLRILITPSFWRGSIVFFRFKVYCNAVPGKCPCKINVKLQTICLGQEWEKEISEIIFLMQFELPIKTSKAHLRLI